MQDENFILHLISKILEGFWKETMVILIIFLTFFNKFSGISYKFSTLTGFLLNSTEDLSIRFFLSFNSPLEFFIRLCNSSINLFLFPLKPSKALLKSFSLRLRICFHASSLKLFSNSSFS